MLGAIDESALILGVAADLLNHAGNATGPVVRGAEGARHAAKGRHRTAAAGAEEA